MVRPRFLGNAHFMDHTMRLRASSRYPHEPMFIVLTFTQISFEPYDLLGVACSKKKWRHS
jgi:hypothetical protein